MTEDEIVHTAEAFGRAAALVKQAGFDMVLIHGGHGWLLGQFMSPSMNHRTDRWGGQSAEPHAFPPARDRESARGGGRPVPDRIPHERR